MQQLVSNTVTCSHCGEKCEKTDISWQDKHFCCQGCKMVYQLLDKSGLCDYYNLNEQPGINQRMEVRKDKFSFLDDEQIVRQLISFRDENQTHVSFYLPQIHCSSCLYLLENMHKLHASVSSSQVNFPRKEISIVFNHHELSIREIAELLTSTGYEPYISLNDLNKKKPGYNKSLTYRLGVAGFCFGNIMLLSFPEYLGIEASEQQLLGAFRILNLVLALPVFFYSARPFFESGIKGLRHRFLNIDAPIALAILVTFVRSLYEIISNTGPGYFDSMAGIVFFMLAGRVLQDKTYQQLSFERDYTSYFPIAVTVLDNEIEKPVSLPEIKTGDTLLIHNEELIPADGIVTKGKAYIDYSFVTGESIPVLKEVGEIVYAGGKQTGGNIELLTIREVTQSYLTRLWSREDSPTGDDDNQSSFVHLLSRYFTWIVFTIAVTAAVYWLLNDSSKVWNVVTAVLIVACPCALLLSNTFTNGNVLHILGRNRFFLRNATAIEAVASVNHIVFDKTGTLTTTRNYEVSFEGEPLNPEQLSAIATAAASSVHPLSRALVKHLENQMRLPLHFFEEIPGKGLIARVNDMLVKLGSEAFVCGKQQVDREDQGPVVYVRIDEKVLGKFRVRNHYRDAIPQLVRQLSGQYSLSVISGDNTSEEKNLQQLLGNNAQLQFNQSPEDKLHYIRSLQERGEKVMMIGDGLNDAGALKQSDAGIALAEDTNNFTPASDVIMEAGQLSKLGNIIRFCQANKKIVIAAFILSIIYNVIGIFFAVQGLLSPLTAAILMPSSSISIILVTFGSSSVMAKWLKLK